jgi:ATP-dependent DNA helicase RecQ
MMEAQRKMNDVFETLQKLMREEDPKYRLFNQRLAKQQAALIGVDLVRSRGIIRLCLALNYLAETGKGTSDVAVLLRQVIRVYDQPLTIQRSLWNMLGQHEESVGLHVIEEYLDSTILLSADPWNPTWLPHARSIDLLTARHNAQSAAGDGLLYAMTEGKFDTYQSLPQKAAVQASLFASPGSTTLITLPTGAGKSLCTLIPAWQDSRGGTIKSKTTLVVVPTVSLALDQEQRAQEFFADAAGEEYKPCSWTSDTSPEKKAIIRSGIRYGTLPLLFLSPEALMQSELYGICLDAARHKTLSRLVIDEAHIIETWGAGFRTEFQFLSAYRKQLLAASGGEVRTLLLSATISDTCAMLLEQLFGSDGPFHTIRANRLRPEPSYWFDYTPYETERQRRILEALRHLPRPAILYVSVKEHANLWSKLLHKEDFARVAVFTGDTKPKNRRELLSMWNADAIDIMVATSAFGLGVDKSDIRTIIHACLPENIDRFYQEVGRSGRDGYSSVSLTCFNERDEGVAQSAISKERISIERAADRWEAMRLTSIKSAQHNDVQLIDTNVPPSSEPDMRSSDANRGWNEHILLLMQRANLIRIVDSRSNDEQFERLADAKERTLRLQIQLLKPSITAYAESEQFLSLLKQVRQSELDDLWDAFNKMKNLARSYASETDAKNCIAYEFADLYKGSALACGGCPNCRYHGKEPYAQLLPLDIDVESSSPSFDCLRDELLQYMGARKVLNITWQGNRDTASLKQFDDLLVDLVGVGFQQLILPGTLLADQSWMRDLTSKLARFASIPHTIHADDWVQNGSGRPLYAVPTVVLYPPDDKDADQLHRKFRQQRHVWENIVPLLSIVHQSLMLESENGLYKSRVNGLSWQLPFLKNTLDELQEFSL